MDSPIFNKLLLFINNNLMNKEIQINIAGCVSESSILLLHSDMYVEEKIIYLISIKTLQLIN